MFSKKFKLFSNYFHKKNLQNLFYGFWRLSYMSYLLFLIYHILSPEIYIGSHGPKPKSSEPKIELICNDKFFIISRVFYYFNYLLI